jgi:hypothetical protein
MISTPLIWQLGPPFEWMKLYPRVICTFGKINWVFFYCHKIVRHRTSTIRLASRILQGCWFAFPFRWNSVLPWCNASCHRLRWFCEQVGKSTRANSILICNLCLWSVFRWRTDPCIWSTVVQWGFSAVLPACQRDCSILYMVRSVLEFR